MAIYLGSRYEAGSLSEIINRDGTLNIALFRGVKLGVSGVRWHPYQVIDGDRYDLIALRAYADASKWWWIADSNPEILCPDPLPAGVIIRVPDARDLG
jgi:hypothetical protein